ncbi:hypothetical protein HNY73_001112 [Argiope bruennichi]|uniref:Uncharacterized protein n=1 Tax=Argiope bruennichi TaxID=94029 RepID=A0A8T0G1C5_ARGBR|nr:hypothetical protein HNY73_001112 [Argiope bruennichi]
MFKSDVIVEEYLELRMPPLTSSALLGRFATRLPLRIGAHRFPRWRRTNRRRSIFDGFFYSESGLVFP